MFDLLTRSANGRQAKATWAKHSTAVNHLEGAEEAFTKGMVLAYIGYLMQRGLAAEGINTYLTGIRQAHLTRRERPGCLFSIFSICN